MLILNKIMTISLKIICETNSYGVVDQRKNTFRMCQEIAYNKN